MKHLLIVFTLTISISSSAQKKGFKKEANHFFEEVVEKLDIPGMAVVITQGDKTILCNGYGYADLENRIRSSKKTNYYIASSTKSFTGLLAVILDKEGIIKLEDPIALYFPELELEDDIDLNTIKVRDLLSHSSGLENAPIVWKMAFSGRGELAELLGLMKFCKSNKTGFGKYEYTNLGYNIYSIILEKKTGKSWRDWMEEKIFSPAKMDQTSGYISEAGEKDWAMAKPYMMLEKPSLIPLEKEDNTMQAAGGLITTPKDISSWLKLQTRNGKNKGKQVIPAQLMIKSRQEIIEMNGEKRQFRPHHYGFGWMFGSYQSSDVIHHFGSFSGFYSHISFIPEQQIGVAIFINEALVGGKLTELLSNYIYDHIAIGKASQDYDQTLSELVKKIANLRKKMVDRYARINTKEWALTSNFEDYNGKYFSEEYGSLIVRNDTSGLIVQLGNMICDATPHKKEDKVRVELIPGKGQIIQFINKGGQIEGLKYNNCYFERKE